MKKEKEAVLLFFENMVKEWEEDYERNEERIKKVNQFIEKIPLSITGNRMRFLKTRRYRYKNYLESMRAVVEELKKEKEWNDS